MSNLILDSLEIQGFRGFHHLQIEKLGRVNLIVGKNNVGKSSLLEALQLYARRGYPTLIWEFLRSRDESRLTSPASVVEPEELLLPLRYMFYGRNNVGVLTKPIQIGAINLPDSTLSIFVRWYTTEKDEEGFVRRRLLQPEEYDASDNSSPGFFIQLGGQFTAHYGLNPNRLANQLIPELKEINSVYAKTNLLSKTQIGVLWDNIALTGLDKEVLGALRIVAPGVEGLTLVDDTDYPRKVRSRIPVVKIASIDERLPLGHLGDGMQRMLSITLALVNSKNGLLLVDEIENGLHYQIQPDLWSFIFRLAHRLNIQVFATTHSWDCIEAFQKAAQKDKQVEGMLISLENRKSGVEAVLYNGEELKVVTRERIEVR